MALPGTGKCHHCEEYGHWYSSCPLLTPPASKAEHDARFSRVMERFHEWTITADGKQRVIKKENEMWETVKKQMTGAK